MTSRQIDWLNIILIIASVILAILLPFRLFLISYAVLGPLHYLTEINWLKEKSFFSKNKSLLWLYVLFAAIITAIPTINFLISKDILTDVLRPIAESENFNPFISWSPVLIFTAIALAISSVIFEKTSQVLISVLLAFGLGNLLYDIDGFMTVYGVFLPTLIHVFIFTALFMLYGALKSGSKLGIASFFTLLAGGLFVWFFPYGDNLKISNETLSAYKASTFQMLLYSTAELFGLKAPRLIELGPVIHKIQAFIAFAYTYHYLNWFSKTSIIKWHKTNKKAIGIIVVIWVISVALYAYDYKLGLITLFLLSFMHVFLEFPLNYVSIVGIVKHLRGKS